MSMYPDPIFDVPELTAAVANAAFPKGNRYIKSAMSWAPFTPMSNLPTCTLKSDNRPPLLGDWL
jgi:hypothetical protein